MVEVRAPGVYFEPNEQRVPPLALERTGVPVFLGLTRRGPMDHPVRVLSMTRFIEVFGAPLSEGYLGTALRGFFDNGGTDCFILRVARTEGRPGLELANAAQLELQNLAGQPTLRLRAKDPGGWGNLLRVSVVRDPEVRTFLTRDTVPGDDTVQIKSAHGLGVGTLVCVRDQENEQWVRIQAIKGKHLTLSEPLLHGYVSSAPTYLIARTFTIVVRDLERAERFAGLSLAGQSPRFAERVINEQSRLLQASAHRPECPAEQAAPAETEGLSLTEGCDGLGDLGPEDFIGYDRGPGHRRGLVGLVEAPGMDLVVVPDLMAAYQQSTRFRSLRDVEVVQDAMITLCERSANRFAILDLPPGTDDQEALRWRQQFDSARAALYFPWVVVLDGARRRAVPPSGHVAGIFARSDAEHGVHKAPANEPVEGIVDLQSLLQDRHLATLNQAGVNCMRAFGPRGLRLWGARTTSSDPEWRHVNVRRTVSAIASAIQQGTQWAVFEPNGPLLWKRLTRLVAGFLTGLRERGMLAGETPEEAFFVQCDFETNPPEVIDLGMLVTRIGLAVTRPVEFVVFRLSQHLEDQAQAEE